MNYYRIYCDGQRARRARTLARAIEIGEHMWLAQGIAGVKPVTICLGSGSNYQEVAHRHPYGWRRKGEGK